MRPIPLSWLASSMTWRPPLGSGLGGEFGDERETSPVRFEASRSSSTRAYQSADGPSGTVWVDARNSSGGVPPVGSLVSVDGGPEMVVTAVRPYRVRGDLHHTELEVRG